VLKILVRFSNKIVALDLAPFSGMRNTDVDYEKER